MNTMLARILMEFTLHLDEAEEVEEICMFSVRLENVKGVFSTRKKSF